MLQAVMLSPGSIEYRNIVQDRELRLIGTLMYMKQDYLDAMQLVSEEKIVLEHIISSHFDFKDYKKAYEFIEHKKDQVMKVIIRVH